MFNKTSNSFKLNTIDVKLKTKRKILQFWQIL